MTLPDGTEIGYFHDPQGRRTAKSVSGVITEKYLWAGHNTKLLAVFDGNDTLIMRFEYADGRMPYAFMKGGERYYPAYDQVGSLRAVADADGNVVKTVRYDSYGNILEETNPEFSVPFGFAGGLHDRDTGLVRFGYRDYDPDTGRWTAKDPIDFGGGDTDLYRYCGDDPVNGVDPDGLEVLDSDMIGSITGVDPAGATVIEAFAEVLALPDRILDFTTPTNPDDRTAFAAQFPGGFDDAVVGIIGGLGKLPRMARMISVGEYRFTRTAGNHIDEIVKRGLFKGKLSRPYMNSPNTINEIIATGKSIPDPGGIPGALRYDVAGTFRGTKGTWELVVHPESKIIYHFNFIGDAN